MHEEQNNMSVGVTHIWPYSKLVNPEAQPFSNEREEDVWDELRSLTFDDDVRGDIGVAVHSTFHHNADANDFKKRLEEDDVVNSRVKFYHPREVKLNIHRPATPEHTFQPLRSVDEEFKLGPDGWEEVPDASALIVITAEPARDEKETRAIPFHLGSKADAENVIKQHRNHEICALVLWYPDDAHQLKYLAMVRSRCPELPIYIFHCDYRTDRYGVEREGQPRDVRELFETQSTFEKEVEMKWVIERIAYEGESTWFAALPKQMKTWVMLCVVKALLTGSPLFGDERFRVSNKSKRVIYLIPEAGRGSVKKRLKLLDLMGFLYDPITNPEGKLFVRTLSAGQKIKLTDPMLLEFAKDADIFIDTAVRYLEGDENSVKDVKVLTENVLNLLSVGARSVWAAHHAAKGFESATTMTLQNMFRGSGEFGAALTNAYGMCQTEEKTSTLHFHAIVGRDLDELIPDMILQGRPYLNETGNFRVVNAGAEKFSGRNSKSGPKADPLLKEKIELARSTPGSLQDKVNAINEKFGSDHVASTIGRWLKGFDETKEDVSKLLQDLNCKGESANEL